jgi:NAD(P)-dependent dehydrogenase (short-subunit alcohol dehydrogenase family)
MVTAKYDFSGKTVLLTGALGSLGRSQAVAFSRFGARLVLVDLPSLTEIGQAFADTLQSAIYFGQDLNDLAGTQSNLGVIEPDVLINNAALIINRPFEEFSIKEYEDQIRVNSSAAFALAQACAPSMKERGYGKIINFCSITLNGRWDGYVPYVASKGAMLGLTKSLARELGPHGIRVNAVSPGAVVSDAEARVFGERLQQYNDWILQSQSLKTRIQPDAIADLVLFLASASSDMISGQNLAIDGGW